MNILALETSTTACSVALLTPAGIYEQHQIAPRQHTALLFTMVDAAVAAAGITRGELGLIAFGRGPGAFTGVRIAAAVAQGIAFALALPVAPVSSLAALAAGVARTSGARDVAVAIDARREEIYAGAWSFPDGAADAVTVCAECVIAPERLALPHDRAWLAAGNGWHTYRARFAARLAALPVAELLHPHAQDVACLGATLHAAGASVAAADALPVYLRGAVD